MKQILGMIIIVAVIFGVSSIGLLNKKSEAVKITNFDECAAAGNLIIESSPRQCRANNKTFIEDAGNAEAKSNLIRVMSPSPNGAISSPFVVKGEARGTWFFEASFPVELFNSNGERIALSIATAKGEWMTEDFVPFEAPLKFDPYKVVSGSKGTLVLRKDNPSGLPENDDALQIPVVFN